MLAMSGFQTVPHVFVGLLPNRREPLAEFSRMLAATQMTAVADGGVSRIKASLEALAEAMPERDAAVILRPTVPGETILRGSVSDLSERFAERNYRGPWGVVFAPTRDTNQEDEGTAEQESSEKTER
jgi:16S rRNA (cytidine1402-2'-O)-methyltransferase